MTEESYEERLDKRLSYVDELKARIAELESEAAAFDTALWSGRLQEVEQYNANANARIAELEAQVASLHDDLTTTGKDFNAIIAELEAQVAEMQPVWESVGRLEEWRSKDPKRREWELNHSHQGQPLCTLWMDIGEVSTAAAEADTLPAAIEAALASVGDK